jgi:hypothetical protein
MASIRQLVAAPADVTAGGSTPAVFSAFISKEGPPEMPSSAEASTGVPANAPFTGAFEVRCEWPRVPARAVVMRCLDTLLA